MKEQIYHHEAVPSEKLTLYGKFRSRNSIVITLRFWDKKGQPTGVEETLFTTNTLSHARKHRHGLFGGFPSLRKQIRKMVETLWKRRDWLRCVNPDCWPPFEEQDLLKLTTKSSTGRWTPCCRYQWWTDTDGILHGPKWELIHCDQCRKVFGRISKEALIATGPIKIYHEGCVDIEDRT